MISWILEIINQKRRNKKEKDSRIILKERDRETRKIEASKHGRGTVNVRLAKLRDKLADLRRISRLIIVINIIVINRNTITITIESW